MVQLTFAQVTANDDLVYNNIYAQLSLDVKTLTALMTSSYVSRNGSSKGDNECVYLTSTCILSDTP